MTIETRPATTEPKVKTVADVLRHAALIIEERGWTQYANENDAGARCARGALEIANGGNSYTGAGEFFYQYQHRLGRLGIIAWNDTPGRTASEVTAALRSAADAWDANR